MAEEMKESENWIICICNCGYEKTMKRALVGKATDEPYYFYCNNCKKVVTPSSTRPFMVLSYIREYNAFTDGLESW